MTEVRFVRRNRVDERSAIGIAIAAACIALLAPASPTGSAVADGIVVALGVGAVTWASASASWWAVAGACGVSAAISGTPIVGAVAFLGFLAGLHVGILQRDDSRIRAIIGGVAANTFLWSELDGFFGISALIGITVCGGVFVVGLLRRPSRIRHTAWQVVGVAGVLVVAAVIGATLAALGARSDVSTASSTARSAVQTLNTGDYERATVLFDESSRGFDRGSDQLGGALAAPARLLPAVAQNLDAARTLSDVAAEATSSAAAALRRVDPSLLTLTDGGLDVDAIAEVEEPLLQVQSALVALDEATDRVQSPWLVAPLQRQLESLEEEIAENRPRLQDSLDAVRLAPALLGADGERRYLVVFTSPAEARGTAGFFGNWAELTAAGGQLAVDGFGRTGELNDAFRENGSDCSGCSEEFLTYYGSYGFTTGPDGSVGGVAWSNITSPTHFPYAAEAIASLYPDSGGGRLDGVIAMDPYVLAELMRYTGPIEVPELGVTVAADEAAEFLLRDQYSLAEEQSVGEEQSVRVEALETLGLTAITRILDASLPDTPELAKTFGPLVEERRLLMWTAEPTERAFLAGIGMLGDIPPLDPTDGGFSVTVTNGSANKIDTFLDREVSLTERTGPDGGRQLVADVTLTNNAPTEGFPDYVIGNPIGLPAGTSRLIVTFYGPPAARELTVDGDPLEFGTLTEAGWFGYRTGIDLGSGESARFELVFDLPVDDDEIFDPTTFEQPLRR